MLTVKDGKQSLTKIQNKLSTNYDSVKNNCEELALYDLVTIYTTQKHPKNGRPYHEVELTQSGRKYIEKLKKKS